LKPSNKLTPQDEIQLENMLLEIVEDNRDEESVGIHDFESEIDEEEDEEEEDNDEFYF